MIRKKAWFNQLIDAVGRGHRLKFNLSLQSILEKKYSPSEDFHIIQVGANDGRSFDFLYDFLVKRNLKGVFIEPIADYFELLVKNYHHFSEVSLVNLAVHERLREVRMSRVDPSKEALLPEWARGIASLDSEHHQKSGIPSDCIIEEIVAADTLMNILAKTYKWPKVDLLQIDVEGYDFEVLKMYDFAWVKPKCIKLEYCNLSVGDYKSAIELLKHHKYIVFKEGNDIIATLI